MNKPEIRLIQPADNVAVQALVLDTLAEFGLHGDGYAGVDAELNNMYEAYADELSDYYVVTVNDEVQGVGGFAPLLGTEPGTVAELRKMYLRPTLRGLGVGQKLIDICISEASNKGFHAMYLETVPEMKAAQKLYMKNGFSILAGRMGDTGHTNCSICMMRKLNDE